MTQSLRKRIVNIKLCVTEESYFTITLWVLFPVCSIMFIKEAMNQEFLRFFFFFVFFVFVCFLLLFIFFFRFFPLHLLKRRQRILEDAYS